MKQEYWYLESASMDPCAIDRADSEVARKTWRCSGCGGPLPGVGPVSFRLQARPPKEPLNLVTGMGVGIISREFLEALGPAASTELMLGKVLDEHGGELTDWATFIGRHRIIVRGKKHAQYRRCDACGQLLYFSSDPDYLYPAPDPTVSIFDAGSGTLVVTGEVHGRIKDRKWNKLRMKRLKIAEESPDGFGELSTLDA